MKPFRFFVAVAMIALCPFVCGAETSPAQPANSATAPHVTSVQATPAIVLPATHQPWTLVQARTHAPGLGFAWFVEGSSGKLQQWLPVSENSSAIVFTGPPGKYVVSLVVYSGSGEFATSSASTTILEGDGPEPPVPPVPPPPPTTKWQVAFFYDNDGLDDMTAEQLSMVSGRLFRRTLEEAGNQFIGSLERDSFKPSGKTTSSLAPWFDAIKGATMPQLAIAPVGGGTIQTFPLPADEDALYAILGRAKKEVSHDEED
jgi:hypothetical protein